MTTLERKDDQFSGDLGRCLPFDGKALSDDGTFEGYASVFGDRDQGDDIVVAGAFSETLIRRPAAKVKMLRDHDTRLIIGKWVEMREDAKGLFVKGKLFTNIDKGRETHELMKEGALDGLSIGYRTLESQYDHQLGVRRLEKVDLREVSVVTFPMLESATVSLVKGDQLPTEREFEAWLVRDAGFTRSQAKSIIAHGFKSLKGQRDAAGSDADGVKDALHQLAQMMRG